MDLEFWQTTQPIGTAVGYPATMQLADGTFMVVYFQNGENGARYAIFDQFGDGVASGRINESNSAASFVYSLIPQEDGGFTLLYGENQNSTTSLFLQHFDADIQPVGARIEIDDDMRVGSNRAALATELSDGSFAIVYNTFNDSFDIAFRLVDPDGNVGAEQSVATTDLGREFDPRIASNDNTLFVSWWDETNQTVRGQLLDLQGNMVGNEFLVPSAASGSAGRPNVDVFSDGRFVVVWEAENAPGADEESGSARGRLFAADGSPLGDEFVLNETTGGFQGAPGVTVLPDDSFMVSFFGPGGGFRWFNSDGTSRTDTLEGGPPLAQTSLVTLGDGRIAAFGTDSALSFAIVDGRFGQLDGDESDNTLISTRTGDSTINGFGGDDRFFGNDDNDTFFGGEGNDEFRGKLGQDTFNGGPGDDTFFFTPFSIFGDNLTTIVEAPDEGFDTVFTYGFHALANNVEAGVLVEDAGTSSLDGNALDNVLTGNAFDNVLRGFAGDDRLLGAAGNDDLQGGDGMDWLEGGIGNDELRGGNDRDILTGGEGNDMIFGDAGDDSIRGGAGADQLFGGDGVDTIFTGTGNDTVDGGSNVDTVRIDGNASDSVITQTSTGVFEIAGPSDTDTLTNVEFAQFNDQTIRLLPGTGVSVNFNTADPAEYQSAMNAIRDFDGNVLGGDGNWLRIGEADVNGDGDIDQILVNDSIARFATVGTADDGLTYFDDHGWAGETRVAGIYIDPLVASGDVVQGSDFDSQQRFMNDLAIENINRVLGAGDYDGDGLQEVYFALTDGTAYLHAYMHADGNIQYANYQSEQQVIDFLESNGFGEETYGDWFG